MVGSFHESKYLVIDKNGDVNSNYVDNKQIVSSDQYVFNTKNVLLYYNPEGNKSIMILPDKLTMEQFVRLSDYSDIPNLLLYEVYKDKDTNEVFRKSVLEVSSSNEDTPKKYCYCR